MNKRIKALADEAALQPYYDTQEGQIEKFAELIIKECAELQEKRSCERHGYDKYQDAQNILDHFGVDLNQQGEEGK